MQKVKTKQTDNEVKTTSVVKPEPKKVKLEYAGNMESMLDVLGVITGGSVGGSEEEIFTAIHKAGEKLKIETSNITSGCGRVAMNDIMQRIVEVHNA